MDDAKYINVILDLIVTCHLGGGEQYFDTVLAITFIKLIHFLRTLLGKDAS